MFRDRNWNGSLRLTFRVKIIMLTTKDLELMSTGRLRALYKQHLESAKIAAKIKRILTAREDDREMNRLIKEAMREDHCDS